MKTNTTNATENTNSTLSELAVKISDLAIAAINEVDLEADSLVDILVDEYDTTADNLEEIVTALCLDIEVRYLQYLDTAFRRVRTPLSQCSTLCYNVLTGHFFALGRATSDAMYEGGFAAEVDNEVINYLVASALDKFVEFANQQPEFAMSDMDMLGSALESAFWLGYLQ